jgi:phosphoribosylformylglycinamidine synthase subunit PurS
MKARVIVTLKTGVLDPQGKAIEGALRSLSIDGVNEVRQGKIFDIVLARDNRDGARKALDEACQRLLANTIVENYVIEIV